MTPHCLSGKYWLSRKKVNFFFNFENNYKSQSKWHMKPPLPVRKILAVMKKVNFFVNFENNYKSQIIVGYDTPIASQENIGCQQISKLFFNFENNYKSQNNLDKKPTLPVKKKNYFFYFEKITSPRSIGK